jgi:hypothetical protein
MLPASTTRRHSGPRALDMPWPCAVDRFSSRSRPLCSSAYDLCSGSQRGGCALEPPRGFLGEPNHYHVLSSARSPDAILRRVALQIAGRVVRFVPAEDDVTFSVHGVRSSFTVPEDTPPDCIVSCHYGDPTPDDSPIIAESSTLWELRRRVTGEDEITFYSATGHTRVAWSQLIVEPSFRRARMVQRRKWGGSQTLRVGYPVDEVLMCRLLVSEGILVVHGATVEYQGKALLFTGHSGAGKSTIAAIAESAGARVLSDDRSIVTVRGAAPTVWGTPWHGTHRRGSPEALPLAAMFLLVQDLADRADRVSPARATGELLVRLIHPGSRPEDMERLLDGVAAVTARVPMAELRFRPTEAAFHVAVAFARRAT